MTQIRIYVVVFHPSKGDEDMIVASFSTYELAEGFCIFQEVSSDCIYGVPFDSGYMSTKSGLVHNYPPLSAQ